MLKNVNSAVLNHSAQAYHPIAPFVAEKEQQSDTREDSMRKSLVLISALAALAIGPSPADAKGQKGKARTSDIHFTHQFDKASPTIMSKSTGKSKSKYMTYKLNDATISSVGSSERKSGSSGNVKGSTSQPSGRR